MKASALIFLCMLLLSSAFELGLPKRRGRRNKKIVNLLYLKDCNYGFYPNTLNNTQKVFNGRVQTIDADIYVLQSDINRLGGKFTVKKCLSMTDKNCEHVISGKLDMCNVFEDRLQFYSYTFEKCIHPKVKCPLKKGLYKLRNATFSAEELLGRVPLAPDDYLNYYWYLKFEFYNQKRPSTVIMCEDMMFKLEMIKE